MADRYLLESGSPDGYLLEDGSGVLLLDAYPIGTVILNSTTGTRKSADITVSGGGIVATGTRNADDAVSANAKTTTSKFIFEAEVDFNSTSRIYVGIDDGSFDMSGGTCPGLYGEGVSVNFNQGNSPEFHLDGTYQGFFGSPVLGPLVVTYVVDTTTGTNNVNIYYTISGTTTLIKTFSWTPTTGDWWAWIAAKNPGATARVNFLGPFVYSPAGYSAYEAAASGTTYNDTLSEGVTGADSLASAATWGPSLTEAASSSAGFDPAGSAFGVPLNETFAGSDAYGSAATFVSTITNDITASDGLTGGLLLSSTLSEGLGSSDGLATIVTFAPSLSEAATAAASQSSQAIFGSSLSEGVTAADTDSALAILAATTTAPVSAADALQSTGVFPNALAEALAAATSYSATANGADAALTESITAGDALTASLVIGKALSEAIAAAVTHTASTVLQAVVSEQAVANDQASVSLVAVETVNEGIAANDNVAGFIGEPPLPPESRTVHIGRVRQTASISAGLRRVSARGARWRG